MVAPTVDILRRLSKQFNDILGVDQGTKHAPAELSKDIISLMDNLKENKVYQLTEGRVFEDKTQLAKDVVAVGLDALSYSEQNPLQDYNNSFRRLQRKRQTTPVPIPRTNDTSPPNSPSPTTSPHPTQVKLESQGEGKGEIDDSGNNSGSDGSGACESVSESVEEGSDDEGWMKGNPLYEGDVGEGPGDEAAMPRRTEADVAFDMDQVEREEDERGDETDSDGEVDEEDEWMSEEED
ncbi:hypothetical protein D9619_001073 [Psilocybe cf. subviscida]|uniref:Uncharacterized protein n=1 Tax=Psilocybe cf. subviscida TaxID=2480587 RepID=A0A8H5BHD3_9AGAR|nr:hypothetical protein D9619_001073 [Psilocybe cf. subviscida]